MLSNLALDIVANATLVFMWATKDKTHVFWAILAEDPVSGSPFIYCEGPHTRLEDAGRNAWEWLANGSFLDLRPAKSGLPAIRDVWIRDFGLYFSKAITLAGPTANKIPGVDLLVFSEPGDFHVTRP